MRTVRAWLLGPTLAIVDPGRAVMELARSQVFAGLYVISAITTIFGGVAAVRLAFAAPESSDQILLLPETILRIGIGGAVVAGILVPLLVPFAAAFLPWLICELSNRETKYMAHVHILLVAIAPALIVGNLTSYLYHAITGAALVTTARILVPGDHWSASALGYVDIFLVWVFVNAIIGYNARLGRHVSRPWLLAVLGGLCVALFHSVGLT